MVIQGAGIMRLITRIKVWLGYEICPQCGSSNIIVRGFENSNLRYDCQHCRTVTYIDGFPI
jgi:transposase-like protein